MNINHHKAVTAPIIKGPCGFFNFKKLMHTKTLLLAGLFTGICASCSQHSCKIEGTVENAKDGDTLYIARMTDGTFLPTDTVLLTGGKFSMKVACDSTVIASYYYQDKQNHEIYSNIFFMENGNVKLGISSNGKVSGTECNDIYQQLMDSVYAIHAQMSKIYSEHALTDSTMARSNPSSPKSFTLTIFDIPLPAASRARARTCSGSSSSMTKTPSTFA